MITRSPFIGLDLTSSPQKPSAYAALDANLGITWLGLVSVDPEIVAIIDKIQPAIVAIDAPLSLPKGLCCLEQGCSCGQALPLAGRACERELARLGIPCFFTSKRSIIKAMVYRAIALSGELCARGYEVIEIYPYASKVRLFGKSIPSKLKPAGLAALRTLVTGLMPSLTSQAADLSHDLCDALIAAYTGYLYSQGKAEPVGDAEEGLIFIPKLQVRA